MNSKTNDVDSKKFRIREFQKKGYRNSFIKESMNSEELQINNTSQILNTSLNINSIIND